MATKKSTVCVGARKGTAICFIVHSSFPSFPSSSPLWRSQNSTVPLTSGHIISISSLSRACTLPRPRSKLHQLQKTQPSLSTYVKTCIGTAISMTPKTGVRMVHKVALSQNGRWFLVCAIKYILSGDERRVAQIIPAGSSSPDATTSLLNSASGGGVDGVKVEFTGQEYREQTQHAIVELSCERSVDVKSLTKKRNYGRMELTEDWRTNYSII